MIQGHVRIKGSLSHLIRETAKTTNMLDRARGLLFRKKLQPQQALWIDPCPSVHTVGMRYPIDVVFMDKQGTVLKVVEKLPPLRMALCKNAHATLELSGGEAAQLGIELGMQLVWNQEKSE